MWFVAQVHTGTVPGRFVDMALTDGALETGLDDGVRCRMEGELMPRAMMSFRDCFLNTLDNIRSENGQFDCGRRTWSFGSACPANKI